MSDKEATRKKANKGTFQKFENNAKEKDPKEAEKLLKEYDELCHKQTQGRQMTNKEKHRLKELKQLLKDQLEKREQQQKLNSGVGGSSSGRA